MEKTNKEIGNVFVNIPGDVLSSEEVELADDFSFEYGEVLFLYYIIRMRELSVVVTT